MEQDEEYLEWIAAAPPGIKLYQLQEMWAVYQEGRKEQAAAIAKRLLGIQVCPACKGNDLVHWCLMCDGTGEVNA